MKEMKKMMNELMNEDYAIYRKRKQAV